MTGESRVRVGVDLGGTKIAAVALAPDGCVLAEHRIPAPRHNYTATLQAIGAAIAHVEQIAGGGGTIGVGMPGSISPSSGLAQNANSTWLNGRPFGRDLEAHLGRPVRLANDANCFALSEAIDGAGAGAPSVFGVILGTGCGGGLVYGRDLIDGPRSIGGEWGHNPLPWSTPDEHPGPRCWCGRLGCMETWVSGPALESSYQQATGRALACADIVAAAEKGDTLAQKALDRHASRLARGLAHVVNIFDPHVIVLGGGLSQLPHLYKVLPSLIAPYVFADSTEVRVLPPRWGDAGGVRGAAWLWN